jgi:hypothetical protein
MLRGTLLASAFVLGGSSRASAQQTSSDSAASYILIAQTDTSYYFADIGHIKRLDGGKTLLVRMHIDPRPGDYFEDSLSIPRIGQIEEGWRIDCRAGTMSRYDRALYDRFHKRLSYSVDVASAGRRYPIGTIAAGLLIITCKHAALHRE